MPNIMAAIRVAVLGQGGVGLVGSALPKSKAIALLAADALSSVAYAPDEIILTLSLAGAAAVTIAPWVGLGIVIVIWAVIASYRLTVKAYPSGGGDVEVAADNLGSKAALTVAAASLADYALTVAVSVACSAQYLGSIIPAVHQRPIPTALALLGLVTLATLRGVRGAGRARSVLVYFFLGAVGLTVVVGLVRTAIGHRPIAASASLELSAVPSMTNGLTGLAAAFLVMRAFSVGSVALTGVETIAASVPRFRPPRSTNAASTLTILGVLMSVLLVGVGVLAAIAKVRYVADPDISLRTAGGGGLPDGYLQVPVLSQLAQAVFGGSAWLYVPVVVATGLILLTAAASCFGAVPQLTARLARDAYLPKQLFRRGDRRVAAHGLVALAVAAGALVVIFKAEVTNLIQLYIVGLFTSMTVSQAGMIRHWTGQLRLATTAQARRRVQSSRVVSAVGFSLTGIGLVVVLATKLIHGAWVTIGLIVLLYASMRTVRHHYDTVDAELEIPPDQDQSGRALPPRVHGLVLVSRLHRPSLRAIAFARATRPATLEIVTAALDQADVEALRADWTQRAIPVPLTILDSPGRDLTRPVLAHVASIRRQSPRELVVVFLPEYLVRHWWQRPLHNRSAARLTRGLRRIPGVIVASVPWQPGETD